MAVTLTVEDGTRVANSNSYASIAEFRAYYEAHYYGATLFALADDDVKKLLIMATRGLDAGVEYKGSQVAVDQSLEWPRFGVVLPYDPASPSLTSVITGLENVVSQQPLEIPADVIPKQVKNAVIEYCRFLYAGDRDVNNDAQEVKREKVDVIESEYFQGSRPDIIPESVLRLVRVLVVSEPVGGAAPAQAVQLVRR